jgi:hypothetical protein
MFAFINSRASCYLDSLLVAMFVPAYGNFFDALFFPDASSDDEVPRDLDAVELRALRWALWEEVTRLRRGGREGDEPSVDAAPLTERLASPAPRGARGNGWVNTKLRGALARYATRRNGGASIVDFSAPVAQSVVDCFKSLLALFHVTDAISRFQTSTTLMLRRPETVAAQTSLKKMVLLWISSPVRFKWDSTTAHLLPACDACEAHTLRQDSSAFLLENENGDRRRVTPAEVTSVFLCQLTLDDVSRECVEITRELQPHIEVIDSESYTGNVAFKMIATKMLRSPVLVMEVSRNVTQFVNGQILERKIMTPVTFGVFDPENARWSLRVHGISAPYRLVAVVCHLGDTLSNGHYVAYVTRGNAWYFYDDTAPRGEMFGVDPSTFSARDGVPRACPSIHGELFFYTQDHTG